MIDLVVRLVVSLAVVLGLLLVLYRVSQRRLGGGTTLLSVVGRQAVGRNSSVTVVTVGGRVLVLGVSEQQVSLLTELDPETLDTTAGDLVVDVDPVVVPTSRAAASTRGAHAAPAQRGQQLGAMGGSILSARTWRDAWTATRGSRTA
ncbi:MAG: flagellar biosynthetic protein FliO [Nocardioidaceae bacterium]|nr:flagellar biosynthetic protein FliO [Nocardioidaceae bacterium]